MGKVNFIDYVKALPEGSTIDFVDDQQKPVEIDIWESDRFPKKGKDVSIMFYKEYEPSGIYDIKLLSGIQYLALNWKEYREYFYKFACTKSDDERWQDERFRKHMYYQYVQTDRPITDQLYNLDDMNLKTLFRYIKEVLLSCNAERVRAL